MSMHKSRKKLAIVYSSGKVNRTEEQIQAQIHRIEGLGFEVEHIRPTFDSKDGYSASSALERASHVSFALTQRRFSHIWFARGGYGSTAILPHLERMLPPILPTQTILGFSDLTFLGNWLSLKYKNVTYVHANNAFDEKSFEGREQDVRTLQHLLKGNAPELEHSLAFFEGVKQTKTYEGICLPFNLSLAESFAGLSDSALNVPHILFLEDIDEENYRIFRKIDSLRNFGFLKNTVAIVLGEFVRCKAGENPIDEKDLAKKIHAQTALPVFVWPEFGHGEKRFPIVSGSQTQIQVSSSNAKLKQTFQKSSLQPQILDGSTEFLTTKKNAYFMGIGGTGMAAVAGIFSRANFKVTGSDGPIYPPMSHVLAELKIKPYESYSYANIEMEAPDFVVMSNVMTRKSAQLTTNPEVEGTLASDVPLFSFPSALRYFFLKKAKNIVVTGTHGKTTTSSLMAYTLKQLGHDPSYMIGGSPKNFNLGFHLGNPELFVLEGDEYDSALFDKGPKFLHYEPSIGILNNIEFDHADIYDNVEAIENEFRNFAERVAQKKGTLVANLDDLRVAQIVEQSSAHSIGFGESKPLWFKGRYWEITKCQTEAQGSRFTIKTPNGKNVEGFVQVFGKHNVGNITACLGMLDALFIQNGKEFSEKEVQKALDALSTFQGVRRRFEQLTMKDNIAVFDDFAHHPTAVNLTIHAFRNYIKAASRNGKLVVCFDPRNATMRRNIFEGELAAALKLADEVFIGKVMVDQRIPEDKRMNGPRLQTLCGPNSTYFEDNEALYKNLRTKIKSGDTVVFMSSGSFDGLPHRLKNELEAT